MLYTVYRPSDFSQVIGQPASKGLRNLAIRGDLPHALLLSGPRGVGKTTLARIFAKAINCENFSGKLCRKCGSCKSPDFMESDAGAYSKAESIRKLIAYLTTQPKYRYRVAIIDESHAITAKTQTSFLKTIEEPPPKSVMIFLTTEPDKLTDALKSRCSWWPLKSVSTEDLMRVLVKVCKQEGKGITKDAARLVARESDGSVRTALSLLESLLAYNQSPIRENFVSWVLSVADVDLLVESVLSGDLSVCLSQAESLCATYSYRTVMYQLVKNLARKSRKEFEDGNDGSTFAKLALFFEKKRTVRNVVSEVAYMQTSTIEAACLFGSNDQRSDLWGRFRLAVDGGLEVGFFTQSVRDEAFLIDAKVVGNKVMYKNPLGTPPSEELVNAFHEHIEDEYIWSEAHDKTRRKRSKRGTNSDKRKRRHR